MSTQQQKLQALSEEYEKIQTDLTTAVQTRQKLEGQFTENKSVQKEFANLDSASGGKVYKLVGPVLLAQDPEEAKSTVESRLGYIEGEIKRVEVNIAALQKQGNDKRDEIMRMQAQQQQQQGQSTAAPA